MARKRTHSIVTRQGDEGKTRLLGGSQVDKHGLRVETYGVMDEANAFLGAYRSMTRSERMKTLIVMVQNHIYHLNAELACPPDKTHLLKKTISGHEVKLIEREATQLEQELGLPRAFVLYGSTPISAYADMARAIVRRAERRLTELDACEPLQNPILKQYVNRLSDLLFLMARYEEKIAGVTPLHPD
ncbi:cob(I)yrinic acid a,c-diamide adenosyltransferase [bacterium]|nr:cob(I)yrinic acid a,c-diamide adenosyltransferase [bacterium]